MPSAPELVPGAREATEPGPNLVARSDDRRALLDPQRLAVHSELAARALLRQGESPNTRTSYASAMRYWCAWYAARYGGTLTLPAPVPVVVQFILDHAARRSDEDPKKPRAPARPHALVTELPGDVDAALVAAGCKGRLGAPTLSTLVHRIAVLSKAHQMAHAASTGASLGARAAPRAVNNPCADPLVRELLARTRRAYAQRGERPNKQRALTKDPLQAVLATCDDSLKGKRDRALLLFAWASGGRRRSEVSAAALENLQRMDADAFVYTLSHSKTNQRGQVRPEDVKPLVGSAAQAMAEWLEVLKAHRIQHGAIFRRIRRGGHLAEPLAPAAVRDIVRERCALAGVQGNFSAHSLRAGFVTEAGKQNLPLAETMALTGHQSVASVVGYFRAESSLKSKASRMLDEK